MPDAGGLCILVTALPLVRARAWWVRAWDFPRQQITALGSLAALAPDLHPRRNWLADAALALLATAMVWQLAMILPYTPLWRRLGKPAKSARASVRLLVVNVLQTNREVDGLARQHGRGRPGFGAGAGDRPMVGGAPGRAAARARPSAAAPARQHLRARAVLAAGAGAPEIRFLLNDGIPSVRTRVRLRSGEDIVLIGVHPEPPSPSEADSSLPRDAELVLLGREIAMEPKPVIVAGDLNDVAWSRTSRLFRR